MSKQVWLYDGLKASIAYKEKDDVSGPIYFKKVTIKWDEKRNQNEEQGRQLLQNLVDKVDNKQFTVINTTYQVLHKKGIETGESVLRETSLKEERLKIGKYITNKWYISSYKPLFYDDLGSLYDGNLELTNEETEEVLLIQNDHALRNDLYWISIVNNNKRIRIENHNINNLLATLKPYLEKKQIQESSLKEKFAISHKELQDAFPEIYKEYQNIFEGKRPSITVETTTEYNFHPEADDPLTDLWYNQAWVLLHDGKVEVYDSSDGNGENFRSYKLKMEPGDAVLECHYGYAKYCTMYVHPSFMNQEKLTGPTDLLETEKWILSLFVSYIPKVRMEYFINGVKYKDHYAFSGNHFKFDMQTILDETSEIFKGNKEAFPNMKVFYQFFLEELAKKGLLKISSNGSAQITLEGKNAVLAFQK